MRSGLPVSAADVETITVTLHHFRDRNLVTLGRRSITLLDRPGLEAEAESED